MSFAKFSTNESAFTEVSSRNEEFFLFVKTLTGKTLTLNATRHDSIDDIKLKLQDKLATPVAQQKLVYRGKLLVNGQTTLEDADIGNEAMLHLIIDRNLAPPPPPSKPIEIFVKTLTGKTVPVSIETSSTVSNLKLILQDKLGVCPDSQKIVFKGRILYDNYKIAECELTNEAMVHLLIQNSLPVSSEPPAEVPTPPVPSIQRYELEQESAISRLKLLINVTFYRIFSLVSRKVMFPILRTINEILDFISKVSRQIGRFLDNIWSYVSRALQFVFTQIRSKILRPTYQMLNSIVNFLRKCVRFITNIGNWITTHLLNPIGRFIKRVYDLISRGFSKSFQAISRGFRFLRDWISTIGKFLYRNLIKAPCKFLSRVVRATANFLEDSVKGIYQHGIVPFVRGLGDLLVETKQALIELFQFIGRFGKNYLWRPIRVIGEWSWKWSKKSLNLIIYQGIVPLGKSLSFAIESNVNDTLEMIEDIFSWIAPRGRRLISFVYQKMINIFSTIGNFLENSVQTLGTWIENFFKFSHRQISALIRFLDWIRLKIQNFVTSIIRSVWNFIERVWKFISRCIHNSMDWIFKRIFNPITRSICNSLVWIKNKSILCVRWTKEKIFSAVKFLFRNADWLIRKLANFLNSNLIQPIIRGLRWSSNKLQNAISWSKDCIVKGIQTSWRGVKTTSRFVYNRGIIPCYNLAKTSAQYSKRFLVSTWRMIIERPIQYAWNEFKWLSRWIYDRILSPIWNYDIFSLVRRWIGVPIKNLFLFVKRLFNPIFDGIKSVLRRFFDGVHWIFEKGFSGVRRVGKWVLDLFANWPSYFKELFVRTLKMLIVNPIRACANYLISTRLVQQIIRLIRWIFVGDRRCVMVSGYGVDIRPSTMVIQGDRTIWRLRNGQEYSVWVQNSTYLPCDCKLSIDGTEIAVFHLKARQCYTIEHPVSDLRRFTFQADGSRSFSGRKSANDPSLGLIKAEFIPPYTQMDIRSPAVRKKESTRLRKRSAMEASTAPAYLPPSAASVQSAPPDISTIAEDEAAMEVEEVFGATSFSGQQSQQQFKQANVSFVPDYARAVTVTGRLALAQ